MEHSEADDQARPDADPDGVPPTAPTSPTAPVPPAAPRRRTGLRRRPARPGRRRGHRRSHAHADAAGSPFPRTTTAGGRRIANTSRSRRCLPTADRSAPFDHRPRVGSDRPHATRPGDASGRSSVTGLAVGCRHGGRRPGRCADRRWHRGRHQQLGRFHHAEGDLGGTGTPQRHDQHRVGHRQSAARRGLDRRPVNAVGVAGLPRGRERRGPGRSRHRHDHHPER